MVSTASVVSSDRASTSSGALLMFDSSASTITVDTCSSPARLRSSPLLGLPRMKVMPFSSRGEVSRSARITISRWSSTSRARSSRTISDPLRFHPQTSTCPDPLYVPIPAPCLMTVATNRDAIVAVANEPVREESELAPQLVRRTVLEQRAEEPAVRITDRVDVVAARVLHRPEEQRCEEQHQEGEHRRQQETTVHAVERRSRTSCSSCHTSGGQSLRGGCSRRLRSARVRRRASHTRGNRTRLRSSARRG